MEAGHNDEAMQLNIHQIRYPVGQLIFNDHIEFDKFWKMQIRNRNNCAIYIFYHPVLHIYL